MRRRIDPYSLIIGLLGVLVMSEVFVRTLPERLEGVLPFAQENRTRLTTFLIGLALLYLAEQITRRKLNAWRITVILLSVLVLFYARRALFVHAVLYGLALCLLIVERKNFVVRSDVTSIRRGVTIALMQLVISLAVVGIIFAVLDQREFGGKITAAQTFHYTTNVLLGKPLPGSIASTRYDHMLIEGLRLTSIFSLLIIGTSLFRPLRLLGQTPQTALARAKTILEKYGSDPEDYFKLVPQDKHYYFYGESFVAYAVRGSVAIALDNAVGKPSDVAILRQAFTEHCRVNGWQTLILHTNPVEMAAWKTIGYNSMQIGSEAIIDSHTFASMTQHNKHFRYVRNKAKKDALSVEFHAPPLTAPQLNVLKQISDAWLENGRQEYGFAMAPFDASYLTDCTVGVLSQAGEPVAYVNFLPAFSSKTASIDHMRFMPATSSVAMHFLLMQCTLHALARGYAHFNLGFVPLAKIDTTEGDLRSRTLAVLRRIGSRFYSSTGLEQFKSKFEPDWTARYINYNAGMRQLPIAMNALRQVITYWPRPTAKQPFWPKLAMGIAAVLYASFPLAFILNPAYALHGLTSSLGSSGQPYAWLFNLSDVVATGIATVVLAWLYLKRHPKNRYAYLALRLALVSTISGCIATFIPLPSYDAVLIGQISITGIFHHPVVFMHGLMTVVNAVSFVLATYFWARGYSQQKTKRGWRQAFVIAVIIANVTSLGYFDAFAKLSSISQRIGIILYCIWLVVFTADLLGSYKDVSLSSDTNS